MKDEAQKIFAAGLTPVALYGVGPDGLTCMCKLGRGCQSKGKHPINNGWAGQVATAETVEQDFDRNFRVNMGVRTGRASGGLVVLDIDEGGKESLAPLVHAGGGMPETLVVQTGSGGYHYYFYAPQGVDVPNSISKVAHHVDIRGEGGQVVGPGSRSDKGEYKVIHNAGIAAIPQWLLEAALATRGGEVEHIPAATQKRPQSAEEASYELNMLAKQIGRLGVLQNKPWAPGDAWDATCFEVACHLVELSNSEWASITYEEAHRRYLEAAPSDDQWDQAEAKWIQAVKQAGNKAKEGPTGSIMNATPATLGAVAPDPTIAPQGASTAQPAPATGRPSDTDSDARMVDEFAERMLEGRALYVAEAKEWRAYDGAIWADSSVPAIREVFRRYVLSEHAQAAQMGDMERLKMLTKYTAASKIKAIADLSQGRMETSIHTFDQCRDLLVVGNGVVDLQTGDLLPHDPNYRFTKRTKVDYLPGATHVDVDEMLKALPADCLGWLQIRFGQGATGHPTWDDLMPILQGGGANGKSSLIVGLQAALGDYMGMISERTLLSKDGDHSTELTDLRGMRLAVIEELPQNGTLNIKRLKDTLGTSKITARRMRENNITWSATHSMFLTTNYIPKVTETDHGTWRRLALIRFPWHYLKPHEVAQGPEDRHGDPGLRPRLESGLNGQHEAILAWIIEGARRWYAVRETELELPPSVEKETTTWRLEADKIGGFLRDRMEFDPAAAVISTELYAEFLSYLGSVGAASWSDQTFALRLKEHHLAREHSIEKIRTSRLNEASRPGEHYQTFAAGQQAMVWTGIKFAPQGERRGVVNLADWR